MTYTRAKDRFFVQPIRLALKDGRDQALKLAGGARFATHDDQLFALSSPTDGSVVRFDSANARWLPPDAATADRVRDALNATDLVAPGSEDAGWSVMTRDGNLGARRVDAEHVRAVRVHRR